MNKFNQFDLIKKFEKQYLRVGKGSFTDDQKDKMIGLKPGDTTRLRLPVNEDGEDADYDADGDEHGHGDDDYDGYH